MIDLSTVNLTTADEWAELAASLWQGFYKDTRFRGPDTTPQPRRHSLTVLVPEMALEAAKQGMKQGRILAEAVCLARDVVNAPHNVLNSLSLAQTATALAKQYRRTLSCQILNWDECEALGMGAFLGVARGSETTARFIHLTYRPRSHKARKGAKVLGIVGKGLLFDTGGAFLYRIVILCCKRVGRIVKAAYIDPFPPQTGYNIKAGMSMTNMKFDCGGMK